MYLPTRDLVCRCGSYSPLKRDWLFSNHTFLPHRLSISGLQSSCLSVRSNNSAPSLRQSPRIFHVNVRMIVVQFIYHSRQNEQSHFIQAGHRIKFVFIEPDTSAYRSSWSLSFCVKENFALSSLPIAIYSILPFFTKSIKRLLTARLVLRRPNQSLKAASGTPSRSAT